jgi:flagellar hook-associated protein 3 FlgL
MRVTQSMLASNSLRNISKSYENMGGYQDQLATGKKINRPSDDPVVAIKGMFYRTNLTEVEQYKRNLNEAYTWMENSEAGIEHATQIIQRVRELVVQGNNGSNSPEDLKAIGIEIGQLKEDLLGVANTQVAGRYLYNGTNTKTPPIPENPMSADGLSYEFTQNSEAFTVEVSKGVQLKVNINPENVFSADFFNKLKEIEEGLNNGSLDNGDQLLGDIDGFFNKMSAERSELGARSNRLELVESRLADQEVIANRILSENEDADIEKVITELTIQESIHRASLAVGAKIIQPSLIDFLR